jgi:acetyl-CoA carboxylase carboxyltransferase component
MVGPESEKTALVRHSSRLFVTAVSLEVPLLTVVIRKSYGLGALAMAGGGFRMPFFVVSWPTGEFGGMGLEGQVKLGYRKELEAIDDLDERRALYDKLVAKAYEAGKALSSAAAFEIDDAIDPVDTRKWIVAALESAAPATPWRERTDIRFIDTW